MFSFLADIAQEFAGLRIIPDCLSGERKQGERGVNPTSRG